MASVVRFGDLRSESLGDWLRVFARYPSPRIVAVALAAVTAARLALGSWGWADVIVVAGFVVAQPFTEWLTHVNVLHFRPRTVFGWRVDPYLARKHRRHHGDPYDVGLLFIPTRALVGIMAGGAVIYTIAFPTHQLRLTAAMIALSLTLGYEWTHFLIHSTWRPRSRLYRHVWRAHRLHHFKNENYWFGVTMHAADHLLGTFPDISAVETSPTCRALAS